MSATRTLDPKDALNRAMPANARVQLGDVIDELITKHNALLAKLDAAGAEVTDLGTDYAATLKVKTLAERAKVEVKPAPTTRKASAKKAAEPVATVAPAEPVVEVQTEAAANPPVVGGEPETVF